ncbi:ATP-binding cassette domain-containing protein [Mycoplasmopsis lipofaciens]|uniref:ATP-binding cassette domain-containing protein n=1 Tax=Mycoplasmopsis lipofaciens TaxID=114884 RepID=UPI0006900504|nr:ATP-binding cassette domain-containing protein [Mycoplasmopsis lipofaciens]
MKKSNKSILDIQNLRKYFTNNGIINKAVDDVSFNVFEGEIVGLIGESGSGKTTVGRSLLRLYEDFNGFVTLDGKIISGKKLTKNQRKFLRRNIQMIFQDPHAALNGQKTVYSTLKEPLIVNGIIKNRIKDIFNDWIEIKDNFYYTFQKRYKNLLIHNLVSINSLAKDFFPTWTQNFDNYQYNEEVNYEDNFNIFYNYLEEKQNMESKIVDNMYFNTDDLINFYYEKQKDYREGNLYTDESELINAKRNYEYVLKLSKISLETDKAQQLIKSYEKELKELKEEFENSQISNINTFNNYVEEFKNDYKINKLQSLQSYDLEFYLFNYKKQLINKMLYTIAKNLKKELKYLTFVETKECMNSLKNYSKDFYTQHLEKVKYEKNIKNKLKTLMKNKFNFDYEQYSLKNLQNHIEYQENVADIKKKIKNQEILAKNNLTPLYSQQDVEEAKQKYDKALTEHNKIVETYINEHEKLINELDEKIEKETNLYNELKSSQSYTDKKFIEISKNYFKKLENEAKLIKNKDKTKYKELIKIISIYKNRIKTKLMTLKSFNIEVKYLNKDIKAIEILLGINNNKKDTKFNKFIDKLTFNIRAKFLIKNLLIKTTIYKALEDVGLLKQFAYRYPHEFSGGQRQRIVIARALITEPKVIVADEPIASLDISIQAQVVNLLKDLCEQKNIGMVFIAHDLSMIEYIADRVQIMHLGKIVESGDTKTVYAKPMHPYTINLFKAIPKISNANEKFENINFELNYLEAQKYPKVPELFLVEENHHLYGTKEQVNDWIKPFGIEEFSNMTNNQTFKVIENINNHKPFDGYDEIPTGIEYTQILDVENINETSKIDTTFNHSTIQEKKKSKNTKAKTKKPKRKSNEEKAQEAKRKSLKKKKLKKEQNEI